MFIFKLRTCLLCLQFAQFKSGCLFVRWARIESDISDAVPLLNGQLGVAFHVRDVLSPYLVYVFAHQAAPLFAAGLACDQPLIIDLHETGELDRHTVSSFR